MTYLTCIFCEIFRNRDIMYCKQKQLAMYRWVFFLESWTRCIVSAATVYRYHHWPGDDNCVPLSAALWSDSQQARTVLGRQAFRVCGPATWNALPTELLLCVLTLSANNWKLTCSRALTDSALDDILDCLFCTLQMHILIDWLLAAGDWAWTDCKSLLHHSWHHGNIQSAAEADTQWNWTLPGFFTVIGISQHHGSRGTCFLMQLFMFICARSLSVDLDNYCFSLSSSCQHYIQEKNIA